MNIGEFLVIFKLFEIWYLEHNPMSFKLDLYLRKWHIKIKFAT